MKNKMLVYLKNAMLTCLFFLAIECAMWALGFLLSFNNGYLFIFVLYPIMQIIVFLVTAASINRRAVNIRMMLISYVVVFVAHNLLPVFYFWIEDMISGGDGRIELLNEFWLYWSIPILILAVANVFIRLWSTLDLSDRARKTKNKKYSACEGLDATNPFRPTKNGGNVI